MRDMLNRTLRNIRSGQILSPGEVKALINRASNGSVAVMIEEMAAYSENFETGKAIESISKIAELENVSLS